MIDRVGEINYNNFGSKMEIIAYKNANDIIIEFQDKYKVKVHTKYCHFKEGIVRNPYDKTIYNVGYIGEGIYKVSEQGKHTRAYDTWNNMMKRCFDKKCQIKNPTYKGCTVCEEWHNFQNFAKWYYDNYYEIEGEIMHLDKDIIFKGNKIYSPQTCILVPKRINELFTKSDKVRGKYPIGITEWRGKLAVKCNIINENGNKKRKFLGYFPLNKPFQAFTCYKNFKENYIKQVADEYKDLIPQKLYEAMYKYEVEIND